MGEYSSVVASIIFDGLTESFFLGHTVATQATIVATQHVFFYTVAVVGQPTLPVLLLVADGKRRMRAGCALDPREKIKNNIERLFYWTILINSSLFSLPDKLSNQSSAYSSTYDCLAG